MKQAGQTLLGAGLGTPQQGHFWDRRILAACLALLLSLGWSHCGEAQPGAQSPSVRCGPDQSRWGPG